MTNTKARKLTDRQRRVLETLATDDLSRLGELYYWPGRICLVALRWGGEMSDVKAVTVESLIFRKLVKKTGGIKLGAEEYTITPAGRQALNE